MSAGKPAAIGVAVLCAIGAIVPRLASGAGAPPPAEAYGTLPAQTDVAISPDGRSLAWIDHTSARARVVMFDLEARKTTRIFGVPDKTKLRYITWADSQTLFTTVSETRLKKVGEQTQFEVFRTIATDITGGNGRMLLMDDAQRTWFSGAGMVATHITKPKTAMMLTLDFSAAAGHESIGTHLAGHRADSFWTTNLFEVDTTSGKGRVSERGTQFTSDFVVDRDGRAIAREEWDGPKKTYRILSKDGLGWKQLYRAEDGSHLAISGLTADGAAIIAVGANGAAHKAVWAIPLSGAAPSPLIQDPDNDITQVIKDDNTGLVVGAYVSGFKDTVKWIDPVAQQRSESLHRTFASSETEIDNWTADGQKSVVRVQKPISPPVYYVVDFATHKAEIGGEEYPALADAPMGEVRAITYKARDGTSIPAYLTMPVHPTGKLAPTVVLPHGGPESRDEYRFDWLPQFLASRGYVVIQPQFRGSSGYGEAHRLAGYRQWGGLMQDDVTDALHAMVEQGISDPAHVCIVGGSYGGYVALAGAAFTPDLYRCAVSISGVSDLPAMLGEVQRWEGSVEYDGVAYWRENIGVISDPRLIERSPIHAVARIKAPILLIHGTADSVVSMAQSETMARALKEAGKTYSFVKLEGEDHWMSRSEDRVRILKELESFLHDHL